MTLKQFYITVITLIVSFSGYSQTIQITGRVINEKKEAVERVQVLLRYAEGGRIIAYTLTSETGAFELKKDLKGVSVDSLELNFSCMGYAPQTMRVPDSAQPLLVSLVPKAIALKEVEVKAKRIWMRRDTITYLVSAFSSAEDRTIGDVLKKMPGIEVQESGRILYQGKELNKFYIEGSDLLEGRYGLATNNISYKDVASVEVMENHQPIRALEDVVYTESPAMNIKLKEDAKTRWAGTIKVGGGIPELWIAEAFAMRFKPKTQTLNTFKGNNTGNQSNEMNIFTPLSDFSTSNMTGQLPSYVNVSPSTAGDIGFSRSTFNQTNNLTSNNLIKVGKNIDMTSEFTGSLDRRESENVSQTTYFLGDGQVSVEDKTEQANSFKKTFTGKIRIKSNQPLYYFNNHLNFSYERNDPVMEIFGTYPNSQKAGTETFRIGNDFDILKRTGNKFFSIRSNNEYLSKPQFLEVSKNGEAPIRQDISLSAFNSFTTTEYSFLVRNVRISTPIQLQYQYRQIENTLENEANYLNNHKLKLDLTPSAKYTVYDLIFNLSGRFYYQALSVENRMHHFYGVNPNFSMNWIASAMFKIGASIGYSNDLPNESLFYHGQIMNNYRSLTNGYINFETGSGGNVSANMEYKNVITTLFANLNVRLSKRKITRISGQDFIDDYINSSYYPGRMTNESCTASGSLSKGIELTNGVVAIYPLFMLIKSSMERNGVMIPFTSEMYSLRGMMNSKVIRSVMITYEPSYGLNRQRMNESSQPYFTSNRFSQTLKVAYSPIKMLQISYRFDHFCNELSPDKYKNFFFSDISASYLPGSRWEFLLSIKNIFNERFYTYFIESELTSFYRSYTIRPRNILLSATYRF